MTPRGLRRKVIVAASPTADHNDPVRSVTLGLLRDNVEALLAEKGATQTALAKAIHLTPSAISQFLQGRRGIEVYRIDLMAQFFGVPVTRFFAGGPMEDVQPIVKKDSPSDSSSGTVSGTATPPVTVPPQTGPSPQEGESIPVPSLSHRAAYYLLAQIPTDVLEQEIIPNVAKRIASLKARREQADKKASEGG